MDPKEGGTESGRWMWVGQGKVVVGKWRQLYSNINKKVGEKKIYIYISLNILLISLSTPARRQKNYP